MTTTTTPITPKKRRKRKSKSRNTASGLLPNGKVSLSVQVSPELVARLDEACGGPDAGADRGRARWIRNLLYRELGLKTPRSYHNRQRGYIDKDLIDGLRWINDNIDIVDPGVAALMVRLLALRRQGHSMTRCGEILRAEKWQSDRILNRLTLRDLIDRYARRAKDPSLTGTEEAWRILHPGETIGEVQSTFDAS